MQPRNIIKRALVGMVALVILVSPFFMLTPSAMAVEDYGLSSAGFKAKLPGATSETPLPPGIAQTKIQGAIGNLISTALLFVGVIFLVLIIYAGIMWMTSGGNEEKAGKAKKLIGAAVIGMVIIFGAYVITSFVIEQIQGAIPV